MYLVGSTKNCAIEKPALSTQETRTAQCQSRSHNETEGCRWALIPSGHDSEPWQRARPLLSQPQGHGNQNSRIRQTSWKATKSSFVLNRSCFGGVSLISPA